MSQTLSASEHASRGLNLLSVRLEPIIAQTLAPHLGGLEWTELLSEMDRLKGKTPYAHARTDVQAQLRVITERLGTIGYPFDDHTRAVSTLGGELRIVRNRVYHMDELSLLDAWRTLDFVVRLLAQLGDVDGSKLAEAERDGILRFARPEDEPSEGNTDKTETGSDSASGTETDPNGDLSNDPNDDDVVPDDEVYRRDADDEPHHTLPNERLEFDPWPVIVVGENEVLDHLKVPANRDLVRSVIEEIAEHEGPIHQERLARLTGRAFSFGRVEAKRIKQLKNQIKQTSLVIEGDGWVWPSSMDPSTWAEFRPNTGSVDRPFHEVAPREVANASRFLRRNHPEDTAREHFRRILQTFGKKRLTTKARGHLEYSLDAIGLQA